VSQHLEEAPLPIIMFYPPGDYELSLLVREARGDKGLASPVEYAMQVAQTIEMILEESNEVVLVPMRQWRYLDLGGADEAPFGTPEAQERYLELCEKEDGCIVSDVECYWELHRAAFLNHCTQHAIIVRTGTTLAATCQPVLDAINGAAEVASDAFANWVERAGAIPATLSYAVATDPEGEERAQGRVRIEGVDEEGLYYASPTSNLVVSGVFAQGVTLSAGLVLRYEHEEGATIYGWRLGPEGLVAMSAAEIFDASCIDAATGEPMPPEVGVTYASADDV
jgi:hypothetical protein